MRVLLLGAAGLLGRALEEELKEDYEVVSRDLADYDICDAAAVRADVGTVRPGVVLNAAAYTEVDKAEDEPERVWAVNAEAPAKLAALCRQRAILFVHLSTDYVFDGRGERPYREDDPPGPINVYGRSKLGGEEGVRREWREGSLIVRTSWLFGNLGRNFVHTLLDKYEAGERLFRVVADQRGRPTYAPDLARGLRRALEKGLRGIYHAANAGETSWFEFAREIFRQLGAEDVEVVPVTTSEYPRRARRPLYSVLNTSRFEADTGFALPDHRDALARCLRAEERTGHCWAEREPRREEGGNR